MAVVPLATMAALTLLQNPAAQPEGVSVDYSPFAGPVRRIQRAVRRLLRDRAETRDWNINRYRGEVAHWQQELAGLAGYIGFYSPGFGVIDYRLGGRFREDDYRLGGHLRRVYDWDAMQRSIF